MTTAIVQGVIVEQTQKGRTMSIKDFIKENRDELDDYIKRACPNIGRLNDDERRLWVLNDEGLYRWAKSEGVRI
jgi:hypothetical protein